MREARDTEQTELTPLRRSFCLTGLSTMSLIGYAGAASAVLWLCIWAVI